MDKDYFDTQDITELLTAALDLGEQLLMCGGEVARVEDTVRRLCTAYGADNIEVFTITSSIIVTAGFPGRGSVTQTRRVSGLKFNLSALEALNDLSRRACNYRMPPEELKEELRRISLLPRYNFGANCVIWALISGSFCLFFGGSWLDGVVSAGIGMILCIVQSFKREKYINAL